MSDYADISSVAAASGCKEFFATFGGSCSEVSVSDLGSILCLVLLPPLHL